ncbi:Hypothetical protein PHPALM_18548 [Phytophthora palmivora]|uniref:Uncharacterized protein n=1 Tax=Phytophthora palmivora TaxID=4796 RepID=A0A2P4XJH8_9STRA|nr:Hypothetical protein PHPALM_18548 [Phytophthora palmivora]
MDGNTQPQVSPFTMVHSAFSCATHRIPSYDGKYEWQSAVATSPTSGQAVPAGALPAPEQIAPRESVSVYVASLQTEMSMSAETTAATASAAARSFVLTFILCDLLR